MEKKYFVGKIGESDKLEFETELQANAAIAGISLVDPQGVYLGHYYIDGPEES